MEASEQWRVLCAAAESNHGVVSRVMAAELGISSDRFGMWVRQGRLVAAAPRVWRIAGSARTWQQDLAVGLTSLGGGACVSHNAAAQLHGFDKTPRDRVEFTVTRERRTAGVGMQVHSTGVLPPIDVCKIDGFSVTSATRTVIDLARARVSRTRLAAAIDSAIRSRSSAPSVLGRRLAALRGPGRWGCRVLDELLLDSGGTTELERRFLALTRRGGLPRPRTQVVFSDARRTVARVDFLYDDYDMVVEVSGRNGHASDTEREKDAQRRNELQDLGQWVYEYTWYHVTRRGPWVIATMRDRLMRAGWSP